MNRNTLPPWFGAITILIIGSSLVLLFWWQTPGSVKQWAEADNACLQDRGQYGDQYGAVNALFSGLAFVGVIAAIFLQHHELVASQQQILAAKATDATLQLYDEWLTVQMIEARADGRNYLGGALGDTGFRDTDAGWIYAARVFVFLLRAAKLGEAGLADLPLLRRLIGTEELTEWVNFFERAVNKLVRANETFTSNDVASVKKLLA